MKGELAALCVLILILSIDINLGSIPHNGKEPLDGIPYNDKEPLYFTKGQNGSISCDSTFFKSRNNCVDFYMAQNGTRLHKSLITTNGNISIYNMTNLQRQTTKFDCMCSKSNYYTIEVVVDDDILPKVNLTEKNCFSSHFKYVKCEFEPPKIESRLSYDLSFKNEEKQCNFTCKPTNSTVTCEFEKEEVVLTDKKYNLTLTGKTSSGLISTELISYSNLKRTIPDLTSRKKYTRTKDSICMEFEMERISHYSHFNGLKWDVNVTAENFVVDLQTLPDGEKLCLKKLPYPYYNYTVSIKARVNSEISPWSEIFQKEFQTESSRPTKAPPVTNGSFYIEKRTIHLFWVSLQRHEFNGPKFGYNISEYRENGTIKNVNSSNIILENNSLKMKLWDNSTRYDFEIRAHNDIGNGVEGSRLSIMPLSDTDYNTHKPNHVLGIYHDNSFTLSWEAPKTDTNVLNYTVYWCNSYREHQCEDFINFKNVSSKQLNFTKTNVQSRWFKMSVSANFEHINTGMHWPICTRDIKNVLSQIKPTSEDVTKYSFNVKWTTENICPVTFIAYNLTYCEKGKRFCNSKKINKFEKSYKIENLKPFTNYTVKICAYTEKTCKYSDEISVLTAEAAPTRPEDLHISQVTNTSVTLSWNRPKDSNGIIRSYSITINDIEYPVKGLNNSLNSISYKHSKLEPYTSYKVFVRARTQYFSEPSNSIDFNTTVGNPSSIERLDVISRNGKTILNWTEPSTPAGPVHYYEVVIRETNDYGSELFGEYISHIPNRICHLVTPDCTPTHKFEYIVRAVNVDLVSNELIESQQNNSEFNKLMCVSDEMNLDSYNLLKKYINFNIKYKSGGSKSQTNCPLSKKEIQAFELVSIIVIFICSMFSMYRIQKTIKNQAKITVKLPPSIEEHLTKVPDILSIERVVGTNAGVFIDNDTDNDGHTYVHDRHQNDDKNSTLVTMPINFDSTTEPFLKNESCVATETATDLENENASDVETRIIAPELGICADGYVSLPNLRNMCQPQKAFSNQNAATHGNAFSATNTCNHVPTASTGGYVTIQNLQNPNLQIQKSNLAAVQPIPPINFNRAMLSTSGYVQPTEIQNLESTTGMTYVMMKPTECVNASGYASMRPLPNVISTGANALSTLLPSSNTKRIKAICGTESLPEPIGGYVTQQDLNILAKCHQQQQQKQLQQP